MIFTPIDVCLAKKQSFTQYVNVLILSKSKDSSWVPSVFKTYALPLGCRGDGSGTFIKHNFTQKYYLMPLSC